jgi:hypothetical protein
MPPEPMIGADGIAGKTDMNEKRRNEWMDGWMDGSIDQSMH